MRDRHNMFDGKSQMEIMEILAVLISFEHNAKIVTVNEREIVAQNEIIHIQVERLVNHENHWEWAFRMTPTALTVVNKDNFPWAVEHFYSTTETIYCDLQSNQWDYRKVLGLLSKEFLKRYIASES